MAFPTLPVHPTHSQENRPYSGNLIDSLVGIVENVMQRNLLPAPDPTREGHVEVECPLTIDEILDVSGMPRLEAYRHLAQLFLRGILR